jgi:hypothetical protein
MEVRGQLHALAVLLPAKSAWYPLARRLRGTYSYSGRLGKAEVSCRYLGTARKQIRVLVRRQKPLKCLLDRGLGAAQIGSLSFDETDVSTRRPEIQFRWSIP